MVKGCLYDRHQQVAIKCEMANTIYINGRVLQGSIFDCMLFLFYINDILINSSRNI